MIRRVLAALLALGVLASVMPSAGALASEPTTSEPTASDPMVLRRGNGSEPDTLDPNKASTVTESNIIHDLFMGLMTFDAAGKVVPGAADRWTVSDDGKRYVFHIRDDLMWSDGVPVTAADFIYSFRRLLNPMTGAEYATVLYVLENGEAVNEGKADPATLGARALGPRTLELTLHTAVPYMLEMLTHASTYPIPKHVVERLGKDWVKPGNMVSDGAYALAAWEPQNYVKLVRNPLFFDNADTAIDVIYYYPAANADSALKQFRAGELDINEGFPPRKYDWLQAHLPGAAHIHPWLGVYYYAFNSKRPPFNDRRVRLALAMTIPRKEIVGKLLGPGNIAAYSFVPPGVANYADLTHMDTEAPFAKLTTQQRRAKARKLLKEAGYDKDHPLEVTLSYNTSEGHKKIALAAAWGWKKIGVITHLLNTEAKVHFNNMKIADFEVARAGWIGDFNDAQNFLFLLQSDTGPLNYGQYSNPAFDRLMAQAANTLDLKSRAILMARAEQIAMADQPVTPIYFYVSRALVAPWVKGYVDNIRNAHLSRYMRIEGPRKFEVGK